MCKKRLQVEVLLRFWAHLWKSYTGCAICFLCDLVLVCFHYLCRFVTFIMSFFMIFKWQRIESVLLNNRWKSKCLYFCGQMFQRKRKKKSQDLYRFSCFSLGLSIYEITHFCIFTALKQICSYWFPKTCFESPPPHPHVGCLISLFIERGVPCVIWARQ